MFTLPHKFESITENQWRAGRKRRLCATCHRDYNDPVHHLRHLYATAFVYDNDHVPESAGIIVSALRGLSNQDGAASIALWAFEAEGELMRN